MGSFLDPFGITEGVTVGPNGISRPSSSRRHRSRSRSRVSKKKRSHSRSSSDSERRRRRRQHRSNNSIGASLGAGLSSFFNDSSSNYHKHGSSRASFFGLGDDRSHYNKHNASRGSFFGLGDDKNRSRGSLFGFSKPSYYKRSSRHGFMQRTYKQAKRLWRDLTHWAKRHPWKVLFLVIMPLLSGGVLTALLARFGLRIPPSIERLLGVASKAVVGDAPGLVGEAVRMAGDLGGSGSAKVRVQDGDRQMSWEKEYHSSGKGDGVDWGDTISGMAKMFI